MSRSFAFPRSNNDFLLIYKHTYRKKFTSSPIFLKSDTNDLNDTKILHTHAFCIDFLLYFKYKFLIYKGFIVIIFVFRQQLRPHLILL